MATCADFFLRYARVKTAEMDTALSKEQDVKKNRMVYANQKVCEIAAMLMAMNGWTKP